MQTLYPLFERNRILKKELLWSLRDYTFAHMQLEYQDYGQGILRGCSTGVQGNELVIGPGIIKYENFICLLTEPERVPYAPDDKPQYLKMRVETDSSSQDYIAYRMKTYLDTEEGRKDNEFELCRFQLRQGAQLREQYTDFADMTTEYDTIQLIHASWGGVGGRTVAPAVTKYFAETILASENSQPEDRSFAYLCLNQSGAVVPAVLSAYISQRTGCRLETVTKNQDSYEAMRVIVEMLQKGEGKRIQGVKERHRILVD